MPGHLTKFVIESHTFYRKKSGVGSVIHGDIYDSWIMTMDLTVCASHQKNSLTFDLQGLSLESCDDLKAQIGTKDSITLTYTGDGQSSQLFLRTCQ